MMLGITHIVLFHAEYDLTGDDTFIRILEVQIGVQSKTSGVLKDVSSHRPIFDHVGHRA